MLRLQSPPPHVQHQFDSERGGGMEVMGIESRAGGHVGEWDVTTYRIYLNNLPVLVFSPGTTSLILSCIELGPRGQAAFRSSSMW